MDVRSEEEFRAGHIAGARHVPVENAVMRLLVKEPEQRYQSAAKLKSALLACLR
jgi:rhodanese-related sulfurtransferase